MDDGQSKLFGKGVEIESIKDENVGVGEQLESSNELSGDILVCGTCIKSCRINFEVCTVSTMKDGLKLMMESGKVSTFWMCQLHCNTVKSWEINTKNEQLSVNG